MWRNVPHSPTDVPTEKERQVLEGLVNGLTFAELAEQYHTTRGTMSKRTLGLVARLKLRHTWQLVAVAVARGWVEVPASSKATP